MSRSSIVLIYLRGQLWVDFYGKPGLLRTDSTSPSSKTASAAKGCVAQSALSSLRILNFVGVELVPNSTGELILYLMPRPLGKAHTMC